MLGRFSPDSADSDRSGRLCADHGRLCALDDSCSLLLHRLDSRCPGRSKSADHLPGLAVQAACAPHWLRRSPPLVWSSTNPHLPGLAVQAACAPIMAACAPSMIPAVCYCTGLIPGVQGVRSRPIIYQGWPIQAACAPHWLRCFRSLVRPRFLQVQSTSCTGLIRSLVRAAGSGRLCGSTSTRLAGSLAGVQDVRVGH